MPPNTNSTVSFAKLTLPYPVFAAEFDPYNRGYLVVGGGGGEGRSGIPNQISVLDVSNRAVIDNVLDIDLSRSEDSAVSLATLATKDGLVVLAGVNSSEADQNAGKNEHFRSFDVRYPPRKKQKTNARDEPSKGSYRALGKRSLFTSSTGQKKETYQCLLRLSPAKKKDSGGKRVGAIATGLAKDPEIVVFNATNPTPDSTDILSRIPLSAEANDLDISEPVLSEFSLVYSLDHDVFEQTFQHDFARKKTAKLPSGPRRIWQMEEPAASSKIRGKSKIRCLRFLTPQNIIALCNKPGQAGAELRIIHLYPTGPGAELLSKTLPTRMKQITSMDICALDADREGNQQFVIAVAGQDISIEVYTTNFNRRSESFSALKKYLTLKDVHQHQMTKICFTPFHRPSYTASKEKDGASLPSSQYVRLASTSYGNTVVVDTFPLIPVDALEKRSRFVLSPDDSWMKWAFVVIASLIVVVIAFLIQSFRGGFSNNQQAGAFSVLPDNMRDFLDLPAGAAYSAKRDHIMRSVTSAVAESIPTNLHKKSRLRRLLHIQGQEHRQPEISEAQPQEGQAIVIHATPGSGTDSDAVEDLNIAMHPDKAAYKQQDQHAKHWDELHEHEKARWRERLVRAGEWAEEEGEKVLLGVLFSEYAGVVGQVVGDVLREL